MCQSGLMQPDRLPGRAFFMSRYSFEALSVDRGVGLGDDVHEFIPGRVGWHAPAALPPLAACALSTGDAPERTSASLRCVQN